MVVTFHLLIYIPVKHKTLIGNEDPMHGLYDPASVRAIQYLPYE